MKKLRKPYTHVTDVEREYINEMYHRGCQKKHIAREINRYYKLIDYYIDEIDDREPREFDFQLDDTEHIVHFYSVTEAMLIYIRCEIFRGVRPYKIADELCISRRTLHDVCKAYGIERPKVVPFSVWMNERRK